MTLSTDTPQPAPGPGRILRRGLLVLVAGLLILEIALRLPPLAPALSSALDPYETLLWYSESMPAYEAQLRQGPHYDLWLLGSSYMMTGLDPRLVQEKLAAAGQPATVQNYGFTVMQNLADMAIVIERWMFPVNRPRYALIGLQWGNFSADGRRPARARNSPMERSLIFRDTLDDIIGGFIYQNSALFHYATLGRNALNIPRERTAVPDLPQGGYTVAESGRQFGCDPTSYTEVNRVTPEDMQGHLARLDALIDALQRGGVQVAVVNIPSSYCAYRRFYASTEQYEQLYLEPVAAHLQARGVPYAEMDRRFFAAVPTGEEQATYYSNFSHPNQKGAELFSAWAGEFVADWLQTQP